MRPGKKVRCAMAAALISTGLALVVGVQPAQATSITVNTALDIAPNAQGNFPNDNLCSLRAAIRAAQNNSNAHDVNCATGVGNNVLDVIQISPALSGQTMTLSYAIGGAVQPFDVISGTANPMSIIGPTTNAANFKISGGDDVRPFLVGFLNSTPGVLTLANLTVADGNGVNGAAGAPAITGDGGAMYVGDNSQLTFDNVVFRDNAASARGGAIYATTPTITNNGGAYRDNAAAQGGALYLSSGPSIFNGYAMLLQGNTATAKGGAIASNPGGANPFIHIERSLIRTNSSPSGGVVYIEPVGAPTATTFELEDSTITGNSSVFFSTATTERYNYERNTFKNTGNLWGGTGGGTARNNIITGTTTCTFSANVANYVGVRNQVKAFQAAGDCGVNGMNPLGEVTNMSAVLAQNGGPEVQQTYALFAGSNAIDNGSSTYCGTIDARSVQRGLDGNGVLNNPQAGDCDNGAYEYVKYVANYVTGTSSVNEADGTKNVQVKLRILDPTIVSTPSPIFIPITNSNDSTATIGAGHDFTLGGGGVTFPTGSVDGAVANLVVNILQDDVAELFGEQAQLDLASNVAGVAIAEPKRHTLNIQDDDQAGVVIADGGDGTTVDEATPAVGENITVSLQSRPGRPLLNPAAPGNPNSWGAPSDVDMTVKPDRDCTVQIGAQTATEAAPLTITILNADWQTGRLMTVRAVNDAYDEDLRVETVTHSCEIRFTFDSDDEVYDNTEDAYDVTVSDNDVAGINLVEQGNSGILDEGSNETATYHVSLDSAPDPGKPLPAQPRAATVVSIHTSPGCDLGAGNGNSVMRTFTAANFATPQVVTVSPTDDLFVDLLHDCGITTSVTSGDPIIFDLMFPPLFSGSPPSAQEQVQDYDPPGNDDDPPFAIVTTSGGNGIDVSEATPGVSDTVSVVLLRGPRSDVTFTLTAADDPTIAGPQLTVGRPGDVQGPSASLTFTGEDWDQPQTLEVRAVDDDYDEDDLHPWTVQASLDGGGAPGFDDAQLRRIVVDSVELTGPADIGATITDDDTSAFVIEESGGTTAVAEGGSDDTVVVKLATHPYAPVDVKVTADAQCTVNGLAEDTVSIAAADWNTGATVTVAAVDDLDLEGSPHPCVLTFDALSDDSKYDQLAPVSTTVDVTDNEVAEILATTGTGVAVTEGGNTDTFSVVLSTKPTANVTVTLADDAQVSTPASITFTTANWNVPKTVTVTAVDDDLDEAATHAGTVTMGVTTTSVGYATNPVFKVDGTEQANVPVAVTDDDTAGTTVTPTALTLVESGADDTYTVVLDSEPTADVTVDLAPSGLCTADAASLTFTAADWDTPRTVAVTPGNDDIVHAQTCTIAQTTTTTDQLYMAVDPADPSGAVTDDDTASVDQSKTTLTLAEGGAVDTYTLVLGSEPTANVTVALAATGLCTRSPASVTFTSANWDTPRTVTVTPGDDSIDQDDTCTIAHTVTSADAAYSGMAVPDVSGPVVDDDTAALVVTETGGSTVVTEAGGTDVLHVALATPPTADVTVTVDPDGQCTANGSGTTDVTILKADWATGVDVTMAAVDDALFEPSPHPCQILFSGASTDPAYDLVTAADSIDVTDDDPAGVVVTTGDGVTVTEGGTGDTFSVSLGMQPTSDVTVTFSPDGQVTTPASITFTSADWNVAQPVTVGAVDDDLDEAATHAGSVGLSASSADPAFANPPITVDGAGATSVPVSVLDDDTVGVVVAPTALTLAESGPADTYTLVLGSEPTGNVTVALAASGLCTRSPASVTFTPANWDTARTVTVTPGNDDIVHAQSCTVTHAVTSADLAYDGIATDPATGAVADDDAAGVDASKTALTLAEAGADDTYTLVLTSEPTATVTVALAATGLCSVLPATLTFTAADWDQARTVTVTPGNDDIDHAQSCTVSHTVTSGDAAYSGLVVSDATGAVADDDTASIDASKTALTLVESGAADTYTLVLGSEPAATVTITTTATGLCSVLPATLTFTAADWDQARTVTVTPGNDNVSSSSQTCTVSHDVTTTDATYAAIAVADATGPVADDDTPGLVVADTGGTTVVTEAGGTDVIRVKLATQPTAGVTVTVDPDAQCTAGGASSVDVPIAVADWNTFVDVTIAAVDDDDLEGSPHTCAILLTAASTDAGYDSVSAATSADVTDDEVADVLATTGGGVAVTEGGATDTFDVVLASRPSSSVTVTFGHDGQVTLPASATFTPADWDTPQNVTVTAVDDDVVEGAHSGAVTLGVSSSAIGYSTSPVTRVDGVATADLTVAVTDDDIAGVVATPNDLALAEGGADDTYALTLTSQPTADVTIGLTATGLCSVLPASVTFTAADWDDPQTVTATPGDDDIVHAQSCTVAHAVTSTDATYAAITPADVTGPVTDDDTASIEASKAALTLAESGPADTYTVVLGSEPTADVTVAPAASGLCSVLPAMLTFTAADWDQAQTVTVTPGDDDIVHAQSCTVTHTVASADPAYSPLTLADATGAVTDDDAPGVAISTAGPALHEATPATTATYTVVLQSEPTADVTVTTDPDAQVTVDAATLTFTAADWDVPQTVTVTVVDDALAETSPHTGTIGHAVSSTDPAYGASVPVTVGGASGSDVDLSIGDDETATAVALSAPADDETSVTATATVTGGDSPRTGTIQFAVDGTDVGAAVALVGDEASLDLGILAVGARTVTATYGGDALHDGSVGTAQADVAIVPRAADDTATVDEDGSVLVDVLANDKGVDAVDTTETTQPAHGSVTCTATGCTYAPEQDFHGSDTFTYAATDGDVTTAPATVTVTVAAVNDSPVPGVIEITVVSGDTVTFDLLAGATDADGDPVSLAGYDQPDHGTVTCTPAGTCTYTPDAGYTGPDSFTYELSDGTDVLRARAATGPAKAGPTSQGIVRITVLAAPATPTTTTPGGTTTTPGSGVGNGGIGNGNLPRTGTEIASLVAIALALLGGGVLFLRPARRRRRAA
jgi:predicted outer membrane repeat protein